MQEEEKVRRSFDKSDPPKRLYERPVFGLPLGYTGVTSTGITV